MQVDKPSTIAAAVALSCIGVFGILAAPIFTNILGVSLQLDADQIGLIIFAEIVGAALASILATFWIQKANWRLMAGFAVIAVIVINIVSGFQSDATVLVWLRFLAGFLGEGIAFAVAIGIINSSSNPDRLFGYSVASQVSIGVLTLLVLPGLGELYGIKGVLWPLAALAIIALPMLPSVPTKSPKRVDADSVPVAGSTTPAIVSLAVLLIWCTGLGAVWAFLINIGVAGGLENTMAGRALAISTTIGIAGALTASALAGRGGRLAPVGIALLIQIGAVMLLQGEMSFLRFTLTCAVFQVFWNFTGPYLMGMVAASDTTGRISVLIPVAQTGGFALGPAIAGGMMAGDSLTAANTVGMLGILIALVIFVPTVLRLTKQGNT
jgi:predicted MFS family arabinose efflux permease